MNSRLISLGFLSLLCAALAKNEFPNEVIVTSADVVNDEIQSFGVVGETYRLYAVRGMGSEDDLVKQVTINDASGKAYKLNELSGKVGKYFLDEDNTVVGPVTVHDPTPNTQSRKRSVAFRLTYTIYIVSTKVRALPVVDVTTSASQLTLHSDNYNGQETRGMTILSADAHFSIRNFNFTTYPPLHDSVNIFAGGHDIQSNFNNDSVIILTEYTASLSYVTIYGPIATIYYIEEMTGRFKIGFDPVSTSSNLVAGAYTTLLSPNWLTLNSSYSTSFTSYTEAFDRHFFFGTENTFISFSLQASVSYGDYITIQINNKRGDRNIWTYTTANKGEMFNSVYGNELLLKVDVNSLTSPETYPKFILKVATGGPEPIYDTTTTCEAVFMNLFLACVLSLIVLLQQ